MPAAPPAKTQQGQSQGQLMDEVADGEETEEERGWGEEKKFLIDGVLNLAPNFASALAFGGSFGFPGQKVVCVENACWRPLSDKNCCSVKLKRCPHFVHCFF